MVSLVHVVNHGCFTLAKVLYILKVFVKIARSFSNLALNQGLGIVTRCYSIVDIVQYTNSNEASWTANPPVEEI